MRKEENDWNMAYLCRWEGSDSAWIEWKFDFGELGGWRWCFSLRVLYFRYFPATPASLSFRAASKTYETGTVNFTITSSKSDLAPYTQSPQLQLLSSDVSGTQVTVRADLSGGNGNVAWQHAQLFRDKIPFGDSETQFELIVEF